MDSAEFSSFLGALRRGDHDAAEKLVHLYGPEICRLIRAKLKAGELQRVADSVDICQSILFEFLQHIAAGEFKLESAGQLEKLLRTMALNKLRDLARHEQAACRRKNEAATGKQGKSAKEPADAGSSPSQHVAREDLLEHFLSRLSEEARQIHQWRALGWNWIKIAAELNEPHNTVRIRFARETQQIARQLGLDVSEVTHGKP
jgi:RNA polymerase sigma factor (sigma-70 family)